MEWLTRQAGVNAVPMKSSNGTVIIRATPALKDDAWIHPGFRKHNFVRRGYEKARRVFAQELEKQVGKILKKTPVT
jgi:hypothetical protein